MPEENDNKPDESSSKSSSEFSSDIGFKLAQIEELEGKIRLLRWGLFAGVLAILTFGIFGLYNASKEAAQPAIDIFDEAKAIYTDNNETIHDLGKSLTDEFERTSANISTVENLYTEMQTEVFEAYENSLSIYDQYTEISDDGNKAYGTVSGLMDPNGPARKQLKRELQDLWDEEIKPAAESHAKSVLIDVQDEALKKFDEISAHSDEFLSMAYGEYDRLTNNIPETVADTLEETFQKMIIKREVKIRKMFPELTKKKQTEMISRFGDFSERESESIFNALFADHQLEITKLKNSMEGIYIKEGGSKGNKKSSVETTLALLSSLIELAMKDLGTTGDGKGKPQKDPGTKKKSAPENKDAANKREAAIVAKKLMDDLINSKQKTAQIKAHNAATGLTKAQSTKNTADKSLTAANAEIAKAKAAYEKAEKDAKSAEKLAKKVAAKSTNKKR